MAGKRRLKDEEFDSSIDQNGSINANKKLKDNDLVNETTQSNVNLIVKDLVTELIETTEIDLNDRLNNDLNRVTITNQKMELDDTFKLNYDFNLVNSELTNSTDALFNQQFENCFTESNTAIIEHNYANVPSTSSSFNHYKNQSNVHLQKRLINKPLKGALKFTNNAMNSTNKKNVKFKGVTVFYFSRNQGGSTVPR